MGYKSSIEWTQATWNPLVGCSNVSEGCRHCFATRTVHRGLSAQHRGLTRLVNGAPAWTGEVRLVESALDLPLRWKQPRRIFVNSLSDLFHERVPDRWIDTIVAVMAETQRHRFQVLTKRPHRMRDFLHARPVLWGLLEHVWWGVSVEDQQAADERIPILLQTPAATRWVSYEPALGPVDFGCWLPGGLPFKDQPGVLGRSLDWVVVGGESGPGARQFDLHWARETIRQCREAKTPAFVKQLGSRPTTDHRTRPEGESWVMLLKDRKGGDMDEWPADLRVREYPDDQA